MNRIRPLSPHLTIYKPQMTSILSILHRGTGIVMFLLPGVAILLNIIGTFSSFSFSVFSLFVSLKSHILMLIMLGLLGFLLSFSYHAMNGIRHLIWDCGYGLSLKSMSYSGYVTLFSGLVIFGLTLLVVV
uniref:Succinate dehydrogenase subunit 3 n=1 Tax=Ophirina amphinema TaxID=2108040 RepID=A0A348AYS6_9EUKA|nr:succinate dehydrogenase subunit 3 [Ophirina amphinema]